MIQQTCLGVSLTRCLHSQFRPVKELKETLLHEMIHAHLFLCKIRDSDHGPRFQATMKEINESSVFDPYRPWDGYQISIFHTMHAEVDSYRTHHWKVRVDITVLVLGTSGRCHED